MAYGMLPAAEDMTPLLMVLPTADPPPPPTVIRQTPSHYGPPHPDGVPDLSPATIQMPGPNLQPPVHGGRHRGGQPPADAHGSAPSSAISCVGVDTCAAADQYDNVMYYAASS